LLSPERLATYVQEQQADSIEERERLQRELDGHRVALVACDEEWTRLLELAAKGLASEYDLEMYKKKLDRRRGDLRQQI
jgi:chromosome segregation and condensation protein ScpB